MEIIRLSGEHAGQARSRRHLDHLAEEGANKMLLAQAGALQRQLFSSGQVGSWSAEKLLSAVDQQRKQRQRQEPGQAPLPPLYGSTP